MQKSIFTLKLSHFLVIGLFLFIGFLLACSVSAATFTVDVTTDTWDNNNGDGICADASGDCSLRAAIDEINELGESTNTINFNIPYSDSGHKCYTNDSVADQVTIGNIAAGSATEADACNSGTIDPDYPYTWFRIDQSDDYPATCDRFITSSVTIDGYSQTGAVEATSSVVATLRIELNGEDRDCNGFNIEAGSSTVTGLAINQTFAGIVLENSPGNTITGNYIGTDISGTLELGNTNRGIHILEDSGDSQPKNSSNHTIGGTTAAARNIISGNDGAGLSIEDATSTGITVTGNYIGTDVNGTAALDNGQGGVTISGGASSNTIGGTAAGARNIISGNAGGSGVAISGTNSTGNTVMGNYIGTDVNGTADLGNSSFGVSIAGAASSNTIGGLQAARRNIISGNDQGGIQITGANTTTNNIRGNYIGTDVNGTADLGNTTHGIIIDTSATGNFIGGSNGVTAGGPCTGACNVISGNSTNGIDIGANSNTVRGNYIGVDVNGTSALANDSMGINIQSESNTIGGTTSGMGNIISGNTQRGISISSDSNTIQGNYIGTQPDGDTALGNTEQGIYIGSSSNTIGGTDSGAGNVIGANSQGIEFADSAAASNTIQGNFIGTNSSGTDLANDTNGILFNNQGASTTIGGSAAGRNIIANHSGARGIYLDTWGTALTGITISYNVFYGNDTAIETWSETGGYEITFTASNNTIHTGDSGNGISSKADGASTSTITTQNNIIAGNGSSSTALRIISNGTLTSDYNDLYNHDTDYSGVTAGANDMDLDPLFTDAANNDYTVYGSSRTIGAASDSGDLGAYDYDGDRSTTIIVPTHISTLSTAVSYALAADTISLLDGTHNESSVVTIEKQLTITGESQAGTILVIGSDDRLIEFDENADNSILSTLTLNCNSATSTDACVALEGDSITVSNVSVLNVNNIDGLLIQSSNEEITAFTGSNILVQGAGGGSLGTGISIGTSDSANAITATLSNIIVYDLLYGVLSLATGTGNVTSSCTNCVAYNNSGYGYLALGNGAGATGNVTSTVKNSIAKNCDTGIAQANAGGATGTHTTSSSYNLFHNNTTADYSGVTAGTGDITGTDPSFADVDCSSGWGDTACFTLSAGSGAIDVGDPADTYSTEHATLHGDRINVGAYGNTTYAAATSKAFTMYADATNGNDSYNGSAAVFSSGRLGPKATIAAALRLTADTGTTKVLNGTYTEEITMPSDDITLTRNSTSDTVTINSGGVGAVIDFASTTGGTVSNISLTSGDYDFAQAGSGTNTVSNVTQGVGATNVTGGTVNVYYDLIVTAASDFDSSGLDGVTISYTGDGGTGDFSSTTDSNGEATQSLHSSIITSSGTTDYTSYTISAAGDASRTNSGATSVDAANDTYTITLDYTPPSSTTISINSGAETATETAVTLTLAATDATDMMISNSSAFTGASWETYATSKSWTLSEASDTATVYAKFRDTYTNASSSINDTITLSLGKWGHNPPAPPLPPGIVTPPDDQDEPGDDEDEYEDEDTETPDVSPETEGDDTTDTTDTPREVLPPSYNTEQAPPANESVAEGTAKLVKTQETNTVYVVDLETNTKQVVVNENIFEERGYSWDDIEVVESAELQIYTPAKPVLYPDGSVLKFTDNRVYEINNDYELTWIPDEETFEEDHEWSDIQVLADSMFSVFTVME